MRAHWRKEHGWSSIEGRGGSGPAKKRRVEEQIEKGMRAVHCQRFFSSRHGSQYFRVGADAPTATSIAPDPSRHERNASEAAWDQLWQRVGAENARADAEAQDTIREGRQDEANPWLKRTGWPVYLAGLQRSELLSSIEAPEEDSGGESAAVECVVWRAMDKMIRYSQESVTERVGTFIRMEAIRSDPSENVYAPLEPYKDAESIAKHMRPWQQIVLFFIRTQQNHQWSSPRYRFTRAQHRAWDRLMAVAEEAAAVEDEKETHQDDEHESSSSGQEQATGLSVLQEACLGFCIRLLNHHITTREYDSALICALSVLGVKESGWKDAHEYPQVLSSMIKVARFMVIQQGLKLAAFMGSSDEDSDDEAPPRKGCIDLVGAMMKRFMIRGTHSPMQWILDLRAYGMKIHYNTTSQGHVDWMNGDELLYKELQFTMRQFRSMIHGLVGETRRLLMQELMFVHDAQSQPAPCIPWSEMRDNPANIQPGWSFLKDTRTRMPVDGHRWLIEQIGQQPAIRQGFIHTSNPTRFHRPAVESYMSRVVEFREKLIILMHITGGQPARAPEILSVQHRNSSQGGHRNVFIEDGIVVFATRYHKGYTLTGDIKIIHRYLPREVGELVVWYLWLVMPFQEAIEQDVYGGTGEPSYLWPSDPSGRRWTSERFRQVMKRETETGLGQAITIQAYRDIAIGISRRFMRDATAFRAEDARSNEAWEDEQGKASIADEQAGHSSHVAGMVYARGMMEQLGVVASKRQQFRASSMDWHGFLGFRAAKSHAGKAAPFQAQAEEDRAERWARLRRMDVQEQLQRMMGAEATFRGVQQPALQAIVRGQSPIVVVMATGGGKSLLFMLPAWAEPGGMTVVVVPLVALREDMRRRCERLGVVCAEWNRRRPPDGAAIVLVTPESAMSEDFATFINRIQVTRQLDRIVIDECHVVLNRQFTFRKTMQQLGRLAGAETQMVMLTATLPPSEEPELFRRMYFEASQVHMFRARTSRGNVAYRTMPVGERLPKRERQQQVTSFIQQKIQQYHNGKVVVYSNTVGPVIQMSQELGCAGYHHHAAGKRDMLTAFIEQPVGVIVATSALGMGVDIPNIRCIIHMDPPRTLLDYAQESGRAGRDGKASEAIIIHHGARAGPQIERDPEEQKLVDRFMQKGVDRLGCRRITLDSYLDGYERVQCVIGEEACDVCRTTDGSHQESSGETSEKEICNAGSSGEDPGLVEWRAQSQQRQERTMPRRRYIEHRQDEGQEMEWLRQQLDWWHRRCGICEAAGMTESRHRLYDCRREESQSGIETARKLRGMIRFEKWSGCFWCGVPQQICQRWEENGAGGWRRRNGVACGYTSTLIEGIVGIGIGYKEVCWKRWVARLAAAGVTVDEDQELAQYFGRKRQQEAMESNNLVGEFVWLTRQIHLD